MTFVGNVLNCKAGWIIYRSSMSPIEKHDALPQICSVYQHTAVAFTWHPKMWSTSHRFKTESARDYQPNSEQFTVPWQFYILNSILCITRHSKTCTSGWCQKPAACFIVWWRKPGPFLCALYFAQWFLWLLLLVWINKWSGGLSHHINRCQKKG